MLATTRLLTFGLAVLAACAAGEAPSKTPAPAPAPVAEAAPPDASTPDAALADAAAAAAAPAGPSAKPVCVRVGTRSEGWGYADGRFIRWARCKGVTPTCDPAGKEGAGWYDKTGLIVAGGCP
jgi:hypothetical protein